MGGDVGGHGVAGESERNFPLPIVQSREENCRLPARGEQICNSAALRYDVKWVSPRLHIDPAELDLEAKFFAQHIFDQILQIHIN